METDTVHYVHVGVISFSSKDWQNLFSLPFETIKPIGNSYTT